MGSKQVRLSEDVYARIESKKRDDETFSEAIDRLIGDVSLLDLSDGGEPDPERAQKHLEALENTARVDSESAPEPPSTNDS